jgi:hypothetical protein
MTPHIPGWLWAQALYFPGLSSNRCDFSGFSGSLNRRQAVPTAGLRPDLASCKVKLERFLNVGP